MPKGEVHIIGAGLAGIAAAVSLACLQRRIIMHELSRFAGGRCRSYFDPLLGMEIDNGNHLVLSSNRCTLSFLETIGSASLLPVPQKAEFAFYDLDTRSDWTLRPNNFFFPWWIFSKTNRIPNTAFYDYLHLIPFILKALWRDRPLSQISRPQNKVFKSLVDPVLLAALNTKLKDASSRLSARILLKTLGKGGRACKPLLSTAGLGAVFIDPSLRFLEQRGAEIKFNHQLRSLQFQDKKVSSLVFEDQNIELSNEDKVILAVPPWVAQDLIPNLKAPMEFSPIVNVHYELQVPDYIPRIIAVLNGSAEWIFSFSKRLSVTISAANDFIELERLQLAQIIWEEIKIITGLEMKLPPWQIVKEKRATFKATPQQNAQRPLPQTEWSNLILAGDWTQTGYPATIEGAVMSGQKAAELVLF